MCARHSQHRLSQWQRTVSIVPRAEAADRQPSDIVYSQQQGEWHTLVEPHNVARFRSSAGQPLAISA